MVDGRHTGTGGGNHFVLGGAVPSDSPFLRRPDLLRSLIGYWHNHPSLSYLFSGMFIGPTSQAPRIDEARNDSVYEIETAFRSSQGTEARARAALAHRPPAAQPADRRHRQHPPLRVLHRQALLARRPHRAPRPARAARLRNAAPCAHEPGPAAAAARPDRTLLGNPTPRAWCAGAPSCTTASCCRISCSRTSATSWKTCRPTAYPSRPNGSPPHFEFRFPKIGEFAVRGIEVELRSALEPWHVMGGGRRHRRHRALCRLLGRAPAGKATGMSDDRFLLAAMAARSRCSPPARWASMWPACATGPGSRRPACTRPSVHAPLVFDLVDTWTGAPWAAASITLPTRAGAASRPSRSMPSRPKPALARFFRMGHTPGDPQVKVSPVEREFPFTLDLRR
jgi:uncharacterized protein (DUF2126 family)